MDQEKSGSPEGDTQKPEDPAAVRARKMLEVQEDAAKDRENEGGYQ